MIGQYKARLRRWWYLVTVGMWRGECPIEGYNGKELVILASGRAIDTDCRIWWQR